MRFALYIACLLSGTTAPAETGKQANESLDAVSFLPICRNRALAYKGGPIETQYSRWGAKSRLAELIRDGLEAHCRIFSAAPDFKFSREAAETCMAHDPPDTDRAMLRLSGKSRAPRELFAKDDPGMQCLDDIYEAQVSFAKAAHCAPLKKRADRLACLGRRKATAKAAAELSACQEKLRDLREQLGSLSSKAITSGSSTKQNSLPDLIEKMRTGIRDHLQKNKTGK